mgnify:CR=1 FL=1
MENTSFAAMLERVADAPEAASLQLPSDWMQGRAGYGGLLGALALKSMRSLVPPERKVRSLLIAFVGPVGPGDFTIQSQALRAGKSVTQLEAKLAALENAESCVAFGSGMAATDNDYVKFFRMLHVADSRPVQNSNRGAIL